jgi:hypothetical protein
MCHPIGGIARHTRTLPQFERAVHQKSIEDLGLRSMMADATPNFVRKGQDWIGCGTFKKEDAGKTRTRIHF